jgi:hypothetical protein
MIHRGWRAWFVIAVLFVLYQSAEGVGQLLLHSFALQASLMVACVFAAWPLSRWLGYRGYQAYALQGRRYWLVWLLGGIVLALLAKALALVTGLHMGVYAEDAPGVRPSAWAAFAGVPMLALSTFVASLAEDLITRGFWYRAASIRWRGGLAFVAASSAIYVLNHIYRLDRGPVEWLMLFCFGVAYATALWRSGNLWAAVGLHWGWNFANGWYDQLMPMTALQPHAGSMLSAAAHLVMVLVLLAVPSTRRPRQRWGAHEQSRADQ